MHRMHVVLIRHAETDLNAQGRYQARVDVPLNAAGVAQARAAASTLRAVRWAGVWSSPARRATATAVALADAVGTVPRELSELLERDLGAYDGQDKAAHRRAHPVEARRLETDPNYAPPDGESLADVLTRLCRGLARVVAAILGATEPGPDRGGQLLALVVTHGGVLNALAVHLLDEGFTGVGPVGNARAVGLALNGVGTAGAPVTGSIHQWDVSPHTCEGPWPAARPRILPWPVTTPVPTQREVFRA